MTRTTSTPLYLEPRHIELEVGTAIMSKVGFDGMPHIASCQQQNQGVALALIDYYLGCFSQEQEQVYFRYDPVYEARLESILDNAGRHQKPLHHEIDCFFTQLLDLEKQIPDAYQVWRALLAAEYTGIAQDVVRSAKREQENYRLRMQAGLDAIACCRKHVQRYLYSRSGQGEDDFRALLGRLQNAVL